MTPIIVLEEPAISRDLLLLRVCACVCLYMGGGGEAVSISTVNHIQIFDYIVSLKV